MQKETRTINGCIVTTIETEKMVISQWRRQSDHERNKERLSHMCHESWLKQIKRG